jgi:hypothetical protein
VPEARLILAIAAAEDCQVYKIDTIQAFLYCIMGDNVMYTRAPFWWPEPILQGHCLQFLKSIYGTLQARVSISLFAACLWTTMMHITTSTKPTDKFLREYSKDFDINGGSLIKTFLGMEVDQDNKTIKIHLNHYVLTEYKD